MITLLENDLVRVQLTEFGANLLNMKYSQKNRDLLEKNPSQLGLHKTNHKENDTITLRLYQVIEMFGGIEYHDEGHSYFKSLTPLEIHY